METGYGCVAQAIWPDTCPPDTRAQRGERGGPPQTPPHQLASQQLNIRTHEPSGDSGRDPRVRHFLALQSILGAQALLSSAEDLCPEKLSSILFTQSLTPFYGWWESGYLKIYLPDSWIIVNEIHMRIRARSLAVHTSQARL